MPATTPPTRPDDPDPAGPPSSLPPVAEGTDARAGRAEHLALYLRLRRGPVTFAELAADVPGYRAAATDAKAEEAAAKRLARHLAGLVRAGVPVERHPGTGHPPHDLYRLRAPAPAPRSPRTTWRPSPPPRTTPGAGSG